jgi:hypothetical protein
MPTYGDRDYLEKLRKRNVCAKCKGPLFIYIDYPEKRLYLNCSYQEHNGLARISQSWEPNIETLKEELERTMTTDKANALVKYAGSKALQRVEAKEIIESLFPKAPKEEQLRAILTCVSYKLNPLNKHLFLIPFNEDKPDKTTWALVMGIKAKRLLANRPVPGTNEPRPFSYIDNTPRVMTEAEQIIIYGEVQKGDVMTICKLQDPKTGAEVVGYGAWAKEVEYYDQQQHKKIKKPHTPYGAEKGNTMFNMSSIRAESQALERLRPGEMPEGVETVDERVIEGEYKEVTTQTHTDPKTGEIIGKVQEKVVEHEEEQPGDIEWPENVAPENKADQPSAASSEEPWTYAEFYKVMKRLWDKNCVFVEKKALFEKLDKDFPVTLPDGVKKSLQSIYLALPKDKQMKLCMWLSDLEANMSEKV